MICFVCGAVAEGYEVHSAESPEPLAQIVFCACPPPPPTSEQLRRREEDDFLAREQKLAIKGSDL